MWCDLPGFLRLGGLLKMGKAPTTACAALVTGCAEREQTQNARSRKQIPMASVSHSFPPGHHVAFRETHLLHSSQGSSWHGGGVSCRAHYDLCQPHRERIFQG